MNQDDVDEAITLYDRGWSLEDVGERFGVSRQRAHKVLTDSGRWTSRPRGPGPGRGRQVDDDQVVVLFRGGLTPTQIGTRLGVSMPTVYRALHRKGIRFYRPRGET